MNLSRGAPISPRHLPAHLVKKSTPKNNPSPSQDQPLALHEIEKRHILEIYNHADQNKSEAARLLEISLSTLRRRLESYGVA